MCMKKNLLFCLPLIFSLAACNNPAPIDEEGQAGDGPSQTILYILEAKGELHKLVEDATSLTDKEPLIDMIHVFWNQELEFLNGITEEEEAEYALDQVYEHEYAYVEDYFKPKALNDLTSYVYDTMSKTTNFEIQTGVFEIYNFHRPEMDELGNDFVCVLELTEYIYGEINAFLEEHGYHEENEELNHIIEEIYEYMYSLTTQYQEYVDEDAVKDYTVRALKAFNGVETEEEAKSVAEDVKGDIYRYTLGVYKDGLCGAYANFFVEIDDNITINSIKNYVRSWYEDDLSAIKAADTFDRALSAYEGGIDATCSELADQLHSWGRGRIDTIYYEYAGQFDDTEYEMEYYTEYVKAYTRVECMSCYVLDMEREINEVFEAFFSYTEEMLKKTIHHE